MKIKMKKTSSTNQQSSVFGNATGTSAFRLSEMYAYYHWKQITSILNPYYMPDFFFLPESASFGESPMVNVIVWKFV